MKNWMVVTWHDGYEGAFEVRMIGPFEEKGRAKVAALAEFDDIYKNLHYPWPFEKNEIDKRAAQSRAEFLTGLGTEMAVGIGEVQRVSVFSIDDSEWMYILH